MGVQLKICDVHKEFKESDNFLCRFAHVDQNHTLEQLGELNQINPELLLFILLHFEGYSSEKNIDVSRFKMFDVLKYLDVTHKHYKVKRFKEIEHEIFNLGKVGVNNEVLLNSLTRVYYDFKSHFISHMLEEERVLFPILEKVALQELSDIPVFKKAVSMEGLEHFVRHHEDETMHPFFDFIMMSEYYDFESTSILVSLEKKIKSLKLELTIHTWLEEKILVKKMKQVLEGFSSKKQLSSIFQGGFESK